MSGVAPLSPAAEYLPKREEELDRASQSSQPSAEEKPPQAIVADSQKQAEKITVQDFQYTGKGSFIDKVF